MVFEDKEELKKEIQEQIELVKKELADIAARKKPALYDRSHGRMGGIDAMKQKTYQKRQTESLEIRLHDLERNLVNVDSPEFGACAFCGGPIGDERRKALPETNKCVACAEKYS